MVAKNKAGQQGRLRVLFHETPPSLLGIREHQHKLSTYRRAGVHHSQETRGKHKIDTKQGKEKEENRQEEVQLTRQLETLQNESQSTLPPE